jgi:hypothetical protein
MSWVSLSASADNLSKHIELTDDQEKWLIEHPDIRLLFEPFYIGS